MQAIFQYAEFSSLAFLVFLFSLCLMTLLMQVNLQSANYSSYIFLACPFSFLVRSSRMFLSNLILISLVKFSLVSLFSFDFSNPVVLDAASLNLDQLKSLNFRKIMIHHHFTPQNLNFLLLNNCSLHQKHLNRLQQHKY